MGPLTGDVQEATHGLAAMAAAGGDILRGAPHGACSASADLLGLGIAVAAGFFANFSYGLRGILFLATLATPAYRVESCPPASRSRSGRRS